MILVAERRQFLRIFYDVANSKAPDNLVDVHRVGDRCGMNETRSQEITDLLVDDGILEQEGTFPAYRLTPKGRMEVRDVLIGGQEHKPLSPRLVMHVTKLGELPSPPEAAARLGSQDQAAVTHALDIVRQSLADVEHLAGYPRSQLLDILQELETELGQRDPNGIRIKGLLMGLASVVFLASHEEDVEHAVKVALSFLHIDMLP
jgi:predicted transcriptional regulator